MGRPQVIVDRERIADLHRIGMSVRQIALKLRVSKSTVGRRLAAVTDIRSSDSC